ncbi:hypothetical protein [Selenomonas ruminantium]|uniref:Uncharacterized protein n=1 Tax=Selenomonas ruminantium TaxID=971 RepID=A0A1I0YDV5_SELRU|nr:hypothetical protein [Selenomonas ruminantium]SFB10966.1 hypothetical protein SAMN05216587_111115 [Selenomonas ruminantium]
MEHIYLEINPKSIAEHGYIVPKCEVYDCYYSNMNNRKKINDYKKITTVMYRHEKNITFTNVKYEDAYKPKFGGGYERVTRVQTIHSNTPCNKIFIWRIVEPNDSLLEVINNPVKVGDNLKTKAVENIKRLFMMKDAKKDNELNELLPFDEWVTNFVAPKVLAEWDKMIRTYPGSFLKTYREAAVNLGDSEEIGYELEGIMDVIDFSQIIKRY